MPSELPIYTSPDFIKITDAAGVQKVADLVAAATDAFALDTETYAKPEHQANKDAGLSPRTGLIRLISISFEVGATAYVIDVKETGEECLRPLWDALENDGPPVVMANAVFDLSYLWAYGCILPPERIRCTMLQERCITAGETEPNFKGKRADTEYSFADMAELIDSGAGIKQMELSCSLAATVKRRLGKLLPKEEQGSNWGSTTLRAAQYAYSGTDPDATLAVYHGQIPLLKKHGLEATAALENKLTWTMTWMQLNGMPISPSAVEKLRKELLEDEGRLKKALLDQLNETLKEKGHPGLDRDIFGEYDQTYCKPTSPVTFVEWMRKAGLELSSLNKQELALSPQIQHPLMQAYRAWSNAISLSKYATTLAGAIAPDSRVYAGFRQYGAATGRMTSGGGSKQIKLNLQNIPRDPRFRAAFEAPEGYLFQVADYPAIEVQVIAHLSQDKGMLDSFRAGRDIYKTTASGLNGTPYDEVDKKERQGAKPLVLGLQFGLGAEKLGRYAFLNYGVALDDPEASRNAFFALYPGLKQWQKDIGKAIEEPGIYESRTPLGRRRLFIGEAKENGYSAALNHPVQGMAADIMKTALVRLPDLVMEAGLETFELVSVVHDEVLSIASEAESEKAAAVLKQAMEEAANSFLTVPLTVDVGTAKTWQGAKI